ncbi:MAG: hypothetical protein ACKOCK_02665 [Chloroflexota bacterium]
MYGTIGHFRPKIGHHQVIHAQLAEWEAMIRPDIPGTVHSFNGRCEKHPGEIVAVLMMKDEPTYRAMTNSPEQRNWHDRLVSHLEEDPEWEDVDWGEPLGNGASLGK